MPRLPNCVMPSVCVLCFFSSLNGVKDMRGYRSALNISFMPSVSELGNETESCNSEDDAGTAAILVRAQSLVFLKKKEISDHTFCMNRGNNNMTLALCTCSVCVGGGVVCVSMSYRIPVI